MKLNLVKKSILAALLALVGCAGAGAPNWEHIENRVVPFEVGKAGATATVDFEVTWLNKDFPREAVLMINPPREGWKDKDGNSLEGKHEQLIESLTGLPYKRTVGMKPKAHRGVRLHLTWAEKSTGEILKVRDVITDRDSGKNQIGRGASFPIDMLILPPGNYVLTVKSLDDDPRFEGPFRTGLFVGYIVK